ncbi:hypothetical protein [Marinobacter sp.]|uniref:hypothetical protein n=1 Tax=Marinobacter sp. TaxID=50741 RepID=UPI0025C4AC4F|nr:hypothetical protein [Marinobacter sp.]
MIRGSGRTDFQGGDPRKSYDSIVNKLFCLPDDTLVYPTHDYNGLLTQSSREKDRPALFAAQFSLCHACWLVTYPLAG